MESSCLIWTDRPASRALAAYVSPQIWNVDSPRAGGKYRIPVTSDSAALQGLDDDVKTRLTTLLVDSRNHGEEAPWVTPELVERARRARPLDVDERADRLLKFIENDG